MAKKFKLGKLTEDDLDQDYEPGRSEKTMSAGHRAALDEHVERVRAAADRLKKAVEAERVVIVLDKE